MPLRFPAKVPPQALLVSRAASCAHGSVHNPPGATVYRTPTVQFDALNLCGAFPVFRRRLRQVIRSLLIRADQGGETLDQLRFVRVNTEHVRDGEEVSLESRHAVMLDLGREYEVAEVLKRAV